MLARKVQAAGQQAVTALALVGKQARRRAAVYPQLLLRGQAVQASKTLPRDQLQRRLLQPLVLMSLLLQHLLHASLPWPPSQDHHHSPKQPQALAIQQQP